MGTAPLVCASKVPTSATSRSTTLPFPLCFCAWALAPSSCFLRDSAASFSLRSGSAARAEAGQMRR